MSYELTKIEDHITEAINRLPYKYTDLPKKYPNPIKPEELVSGWEALLISYVALAQEYEDICFKILDSLKLENADGSALDKIGNWVGVDRNGLTDEDYLKNIYIQIAANNSEGRYSDLHDIISLIGYEILNYLQPSPATFLIYLGTVASSDVKTLEDVIQVAKAAGINDNLGLIPNDPDNPIPPDENTLPFGFLGSNAKSFGIINGSDVTVGGRYTIRI